MNVQEAINKLNNLVKTHTGKELESLDKAIIQEVLNDKPYDKMNISGYSLEYIKKNAAPNLFHRLTKILNQPVSKKTLKLVVEELFTAPNPNIHYAESHTESIWNIEPDITSFYGREQEIKDLQKLLIQTQCKLLSITGYSGIGKTSLLSVLLEAIKDKFNYVKAINLQNAPSLNHILEEILKGFPSDDQNLLTVEDKISKLLKLLQQHRILLAFDQLEEIIAPGLAGKLKPGHEDYGKLFKQIAEQKHQSCLILTSFESLPNFNLMLSNNPKKIYEYQLKGLDIESAKQLLQDCQIDINQNSIKDLIGKYKGHPIILKMAAFAIQEFHGGKINEFLQGTLFLPGDYIDGFLDKQFSYLSKNDINIIKYIASIAPISMEQLFREFSNSISQSELRNCMQNLLRKLLIEKDANNHFTISNAIVKKYVIKYLD